MIYKSKSPAETQKIAGRLAENLTKRRQRSALVLGLSGGLGSGKTAFVRGFLAGLGVKKRVTSPTFILMKRFPIRINLRGRSHRYASIYHLDCYRIKKPRELTTLGLKEILNNSQNIVLIEWAEKVKKLLPQNTFWFKFEHGEKANQRIIKSS